MTALSDFFSLPQHEQRELLEGAAYRTSWTAKMLEKDLWVVWTLHALFSQPDAPRYAFKGGTCLSKVYGAIHRFSEDVDVTVDPDHPTFLEGLRPVEDGIAKSQLKKRGDLARSKLPDYVSGVLAPHLTRWAERLPQHVRPTVMIDGLPEGHVRLHYPSALEPTPEPPYIGESVLVELGARASTEPSSDVTVTSYLSGLTELRNQVAFPTATVRALSLHRTFWEKVTLIHFENTRNDQATPPKRYARHWSDLHALANRPNLVNEAMADRATLRLVLRVKHAHYSGKGVRYKDCGNGRLRLSASSELLHHLELDHEQMIRSGMFVQAPAPFAAIAARLTELEATINEHFSASPIEI